MTIVRSLMTAEHRQAKQVIRRENAPIYLPFSLWSPKELAIAQSFEDRCVGRWRDSAAIDGVADGEECRSLASWALLTLYQCMRSAGRGEEGSPVLFLPKAHVRRKSCLVDGLVLRPTCHVKVARQFCTFPSRTCVSVILPSCTSITSKRTRLNWSFSTHILRLGLFHAS